MTYRVQVAWGHLRKGAVLSASDLAGCNITMLLARGVLAPVAPKRKTTKAPAQPVEPEEQ